MKRRDFLNLSIKAAIAAGYSSAIPVSILKSRTAHAEPLLNFLSNPAMQPMFTEMAPNAMAADFKYVIRGNRLKITTMQTVQMTGLVGVDGVTKVPTTVWGYGTSAEGVSWPGKTIERHVDDAPLTIKWENKLIDPMTGLPLPHLVPIDTSLHWAYALPGYEMNSIAQDGVPLVPHMHGGRNDWASDGNPEYFFSPGWGVLGPRWVDKQYTYGGPDWNDAAGMMWYHDHALGITRSNVYAGLAGFFPLRDDNDTGMPGNPAGLPADPYELGYAIQDRMFWNNGELFYPAFPGDPSYSDFIFGEGATLSAGVDKGFFTVFTNPTAGQGDPPGEPENGFGPTALAEFFGDHILVNGKIWPKASVENRQYRVRLLNGTDSRFMLLKLRVVAGGANSSTTEIKDEDGNDLWPELGFYVVGSDQGLRANPKRVTEVYFMPGERLDLVFDFNEVAVGDRVIMENILGDAPFGGDLPDPDPANGDVYPERRTDRVMAFDVEFLKDESVVSDTTITTNSSLGGSFVNGNDVTHTRKLALFEGTDEFGRLQPMLGTAEAVLDVSGAWAEGSLPFHAPITENPSVGDTEIWEIYNNTGDAHPIHVHLVHFEVINREGFAAALIDQDVIQHNGEIAAGFKMGTITLDGNVSLPGPTEETRRDMVMALPNQVTRIKMTFDKPGRYVWHCHILSHEDHDMMRPFHVGPIA